MSKTKNTKPKKSAAKVKKAPAIKSERLTKTMAVFEALNKQDGATVEEIAAITGWKNHSVRGFLSTQKKKRDDFNLEKFTRTDGKTAYKLEITEHD